MVSIANGYILVSNLVVSIRDDAMTGVIVWLDEVVGKTDESNT